MRMRSVLTVAAAIGTLLAVATPPASATEYNSALKIRGVRYDPPGADSNNCRTGNSADEYLIVKNYSRTATVNLRGYVVRDAAGNRFPFTANHYLQPGDYVRLRGGHGTDSDRGNVVYRDNCNFLWNNSGDTIYLYKPTGSRADVHAYTKTGTDRNRDGYIAFHS
jgi:hypothetical protein